MNTWVVGLVIAGAVVLVIVRRFQGTPVVARRVLILPLVLGVLGVRDVASAAHGGLGSTDVALLAVTGVVSVAVGVARGRTIRLDLVDGVLIQRYRAATLGWWLVAVALRLLLHYVADGMHAAVGGSMAALPLTLAATFLAEGLVVLGRSAGLNGGADGPAPSARPGRVLRADQSLDGRRPYRQESRR